MSRAAGLACRLACSAAALGAVLAWAVLVPSAGAGGEGAGGNLPADTAEAGHGPLRSAPSAQGRPLGRAAQSAVAASEPPVPATSAAASITLAGPSALQVGELGELVVALGPGPGIRTLGITVRFDPDVLQARMAAPGTWAGAGVGGADVVFVADIPEDAARAEIRSTVPGDRANAAGGTVAMLQFQAVGPGVTQVQVTGIRAWDHAGRPAAFPWPMPGLRVTVVAAPPPGFVPAPHSTAAAAEAAIGHSD
jgi:hypothetical protein